jgi:leucyl-tRNA synthetase
MARAYDVGEVERKWQRHWAEQGTYEIDNDDPREKFYALCMYPYPSGPAHQGHVRNYTFGDLVVRYQTMLGKGVLSPIGFDSFGLPAENAAIKTGTHPRVFTDARIAELTASLTRLGAVYDWRREVHSHEPAYIKWTQLIFLRLWEAGLAYRAMAPVNWCPGCQTVLANEQVLTDGTCDRSGDVVERRELEQWFLRITSYADELLFALDDLEWPERAKVMQRNWIGRSEGAEFDLPVEGRSDLSVRVFTTRPDTSFGMTYAVIAPEHPQVDELTTGAQRQAVEELRQRAAEETEIERMAEGDPSALDKRGAFTGSRADQPLHGLPGPRVCGRLRPDGLRDRGDHGRAGRGRTRLGLCHPPRPAHRAHGPATRGLGRQRRRCVHRGRRQDQQRLPRRPRHRHGQGARHRVARGEGHRRAQGQLPAS